MIRPRRPLWAWVMTAWVPWAWMLAAGPAMAASPEMSTIPPEPVVPAIEVPPPEPSTRNGREIYERFRDGLSDPQCETGVSPRWSRHFATAPDRLSEADDTLLPLFGYVVDAMRDAHLPSEYALIPFVESGYKPGARSPAGPAGLWQMIRLTARNHRVPITAQYDGRLSPVDSTRAAVRYLKTLHGMFAGDWRLAAMAYNAGEYRIFGALKRGGQVARDARPEQLPGLPGITQAYVRKIHALSCLIAEAGDDEDWLEALDRPVPRLRSIEVPTGIDRVEQFAARTGQDPAQLRRLNPAFNDGRIRRPAGATAYLLTASSGSMGAIEPAAASTATATASGDIAPQVTMADASDQMQDRADVAPARRHTVTRGENAWTIARRYGLRLSEMLDRNGLTAGSVLRPGQVLQLDASTAPAE
jgi:membrane-bound lytic murein transglycosylase D